MNRLTQLLILAFCSCLFFSCAQSQQKQADSSTLSPKPLATVELLAGTYTNKGSQGIYQLDFDTETGVLSEPRLLVETENPSYLTISKDRKHVFSVNEGVDGKVSSFKWNEDKSQLVLINQQPSEGDYPCYIDLNATDDVLAVANYGTGNVAVYKTDKEGKISPSPILLQQEGAGPVLPSQAGPRGHCAEFQGSFMYVVDLGIDQIITYPVNESGIVGMAASRLSLEAGDGPRHIVFHPDKNLAFVLNELSSSVASLKVDPESGSLEILSRVSILPEDFEGKNSSADIHLSKDGKFVYASNRGHNSIATIAVGENGELERKGITSVEGETPRNFVLSPDNKFLIAANQNTDDLTVFSIDPQTGLLTFTGQKVSIASPVCLKF